jgi:hypothetical protein
MDGSISIVEMPPSPMRRAVSSVPLSLLALCAGCGATGLDWVGEAHLESASQQRVNTASVSNLVGTSASIPAATEQISNDSRPRLNHTITLGEIEAAPARSEAPGAVPGRSVIVNNYNQVNVVTPSFGYGYYGNSRNPAGFSPARVTPYSRSPSASGPLPGQNWPAVADHGPSFPYATLPASPWTRTR